MKHRRAQLALAVAIVAVASSLGAAASQAASPTVSARLFAHAGPVMMHADLTLTVTPPTAVPTGSTLSDCQPSGVNPRMGIASRLLCTNATGQQVVVRVAPTSASLGYRLSTTSSLASMHAMTVEIRHNTTVVVTLTPSSGTVTIPLGQTAGLLSGHDKLYVQVGGHTFHGKIHRTG